MNGRQIHRGSTYVLSVVMAVIGVALLVQVLAGEGSIVSPRMLLGLLFIAAGAGRAYVETRRSGGSA